MIMAKPGSDCKSNTPPRHFSLADPAIQLEMYAAVTKLDLLANVNMTGSPPATIDIPGTSLERICLTSYAMKEGFGCQLKQGSCFA